METHQPNVKEPEGDNYLNNQRYNFHLRAILDAWSEKAPLGFRFLLFLMNHLLETAQAISALGFVGYGIGCLTTQRMQAEFVRYRLPQLRVLTGTLQIAAGMGLILGYAFPLLAMLASLGLSLMMIVALGVRLKIKDPVSGFLQALACLFLNVFVFKGYLLMLIAKA